MENNIRKRDSGTPIKIVKWMKTLEKVLEDPNTFILTMKELVTYVNGKLPKSDRIHEKTFLKWANPNSDRYVGRMGSITEEQAEDFLHIIDFSKIKQKLVLAGKMMDDDGGNKWGTAWLLERKFDDLKLKQEVQIGSGGITLSIEGGNSVQNTLDAIDVDFDDVTDQKQLK